MTDEETIFNVKCDKKCVVHKLATHNTCWNCAAIRNSLYYQEEVKNMSDEEIVKTREEVNKECEL